MSEAPEVGTNLFEGMSKAEIWFQNFYRDMCIRGPEYIINTELPFLRKLAKELQYGLNPTQVQGWTYAELMELITLLESRCGQTPATTN